MDERWWFNMAAPIPEHVRNIVLVGQDGAGKQAGIQVFRRNSNNLRYADGTTLMAESEEEIKILLMMMKEESEKAVLKLKK